MSIARVNEGSSAALTVRLYDHADELIVPQSVEYRVDCVYTQNPIRGWTALTPASEIEIDLTPEDNDIQIESREVEKHEVTVRAVSVGKTLTAKYQYEVANLRFMS